MSGRTRWMISATARAWALSGEERSRCSSPGEARFRLELKVAMRMGFAPAAQKAAAGIKPAANRISNTRRPRMRPASELEPHRSHDGARGADGIETHRGAHTRARADVAEVVLVEQVGDVELHFGALHALEREAVGQVEVEHLVARRDLGVEVGAVTVIHLL